MRTLFFSLVMLFGVIGLSFGQSPRAYNNSTTIKAGRSHTNSVGITTFYNQKSQQVGSTEKGNSGTIKYFNNKSEYLGFAEKKSTGNIFIYDKNSRKIGALSRPGDDWTDTVFWQYFYK